MRKYISLYLTLCLLILSFPISRVLAAENMLANGNFEASTLLWTQGELSQNEACLGTGCLSFSFPVPKTETVFLHYTSFLEELKFESDMVYSLSFYIRADHIGDVRMSPTCSLMPTDAKSVNVQVKNVSTVWQKVSIVFMVSTSARYELALMIDSPFENTTFFIDDMLLTSVDFVPTRLAIEGRHVAEVPTLGENNYTYVPVALDQNGNTIHIQNALISAWDTLPKGVSFREETGTLSVSSDAPSGEKVTLWCMPPEGNPNLSSAPITIALSANMIPNGTFEDIPKESGWDMEERAFIVAEETDGNQYAHLKSTETGVTTLFPAYPFFLQADTMYVFRARLRSDTPGDNMQIRSQVLPPDEESIIRVQVADVCGDVWTEVMASFFVLADGIYNVAFDFLGNETAPIFVDDIRLQPELPAPSVIYFDAPAHMAIPVKNEATLPLPFAVYTQLGFPEEADVAFSVSPENAGVFIEGNILTVNSEATENTYTITASLCENPSVQCARTIQITKESIGDGSFEKGEPGTWWKTASPSHLQYVTTYNGAYPAEGNRFARLTMNGSVSALMSNSVYQYNASESYVLEANMKVAVPDIPTVVTVLVDNAASDSFDDNLVIGQFTLSHSMQRIQKLFTPSMTVSGRLMIAFNTPETHDQQIVLLDMISILPASVSAHHVTISGMPYLDKNIQGTYRFSSNFNAVDSSSCRWLISSSRDGIFMPLESQTGSTLSITADMLGKYVKFEVTPISLSGPVVGASVTSASILIGDSLPSTDTEPEVTAPPEITPAVPTPPPAPPISSSMHVLQIDKFTVTDKHCFFDLQTHWAKKEVEKLAAAGVLEGRGNGLFEPEALITRAEFSAILARAFELAPIYYEGQFDDVKPFSWYSGAIAVVTKYGIAQGTGNRTFSPDLPITREEMAVMIMRAYQKTGAQTKTAAIHYGDDASISPWAIQAVQESGALGLLIGFADGNFLPTRKATRAEAAVTMYRMLSILS